MKRRFGATVTFFTSFMKRPDLWGAWVLGRFGKKRGNKKGNKKDVWRNYLIKKSMWRSPLTNRKLLGHW